MFRQLKLHLYCDYFAYVVAVVIIFLLILFVSQLEVNQMVKRLSFELNSHAPWFVTMANNEHWICDSRFSRKMLWLFRKYRSMTFRNGKRCSKMSIKHVKKHDNDIKIDGQLCSDAYCRNRFVNWCRNWINFAFIVYGNKSSIDSFFVYLHIVLYWWDLHGFF